MSTDRPTTQTPIAEIAVLPPAALSTVLKMPLGSEREARVAAWLKDADWGKSAPPLLSQWVVACEAASLSAEESESCFADALRSVGNPSSAADVLLALNYPLSADIVRRCRRQLIAFTMNVDGLKIKRVASAITTGCGGPSAAAEDVLAAFGSPLRSQRNAVWHQRWAQVLKLILQGSTKPNARRVAPQTLDAIAEIGAASPPESASSINELLALVQQLRDGKPALPESATVGDSAPTPIKPTRTPATRSVEAPQSPMGSTDPRVQLSTAVEAMVQKDVEREVASLAEQLGDQLQKAVDATVQRVVERELVPKSDKLGELVTALADSLGRQTDELRQVRSALSSLQSTISTSTAAFETAVRRAEVECDRVVRERDRVAAEFSQLREDSRRQTEKTAHDLERARAGMVQQVRGAIMPQIEQLMQLAGQTESGRVSASDMKVVVDRLRHLMERALSPQSPPSER